MIKVMITCPCGAMLIPASISGKRHSNEPSAEPILIYCPLPHCAQEKIINR